MSNPSKASRKLIAYTLGEELCNAITHGAGSLLGVAGLVLLMLAASGPWQAAAGAIYGACLILLFTMSCLYHAITHRSAKYVMRVFDHTSIFLLIAGTYTPFTLVSLRPEYPVTGWVIFSAVWASAIVGIVLNAISIEKFTVLSMICYIASGWCIVAALIPLLRVMPVPAIVLLVSGGLCYTGGLAFYAMKWRYMHSIWHLFVLAGAILHYLCVLLYVM